jgi:hypothetical protein
MEKKEVHLCTSQNEDRAVRVVPALLVGIRSFLATQAAQTNSTAHTQLIVAQAATTDPDQAPH